MIDVAACRQITPKRGHGANPCNNRQGGRTDEGIPWSLGGTGLTQTRYPAYAGTGRQPIQSLQNLLKVLDQLRQMEEGAQVVVTHDRRFAEAFADRVIWMKKGKIHKIGDASLCKEYFQSLQQIPYFNR